MTDLPKRLRRLYVQDGTNYVQEAADEIERLRAEVDALRDEARDKALRFDLDQAGIERRETEAVELIALRAERDALLRHGFVPCDIPACNCGSWHPRFGYPERMREIADALADAGHELSNENGNKPLNALRQLVAERDALAKALTFYATQEHFILSDDNMWDTVSGEPPNWWCDGAGTATVEDGSIARLVLAGGQSAADVISQIEKERSE